MGGHWVEERFYLRCVTCHNQFVNINGDKATDFDFHIYGYFTNTVINSNANRLSDLFSRPHTYFDKNKEYCATNTDEVLIDALLSVVAIAFDLEAIRNKIVTSNNIVPVSIWNDIAKLIYGDDEIKQEVLIKLIKEIFIVRNSVAHSHLYRIEVIYKDFQPVKTIPHKIKTAFKQGDKKHKENVQGQMKKTKFSNLNTIIAMISFSDVIKMLIVLDLTAKLLLSKSHLSFLPIHYESRLNLNERAKWGSASFDLTFIILHFIRKLEIEQYEYKEIRDFVEILSKYFYDIDHSPYGKYQLFNYGKWLKTNDLFK